MRALARPIKAETSMSERLALVASGVAIIAGLAAIAYLFGRQISDQLTSLAINLPQAAEQVSKTVPLANLVSASSLGTLIVNAVSWGTTIFGAAGALIIVLVGGIYFAVNPELYRNGFLMLFPEPWRSHIESTMDDAGAALRLWLSGQLLAMRAVGVMISVGLILVGVPSPLALGVVAGGLEFIPFIGPVLGAIPALLLASSQDWHTVTWTALVFFVVQQIENNLLMPLAGSPGYARRCLFTRPRGRGAAPACVSSRRPRGRCRAGRTPLRSSSAASSASRTGRRERPSRRSW